MATAGEDSCIMIIDAWTLQVIKKVDTGTVSNLTSLKFSSDGLHLGFIGKRMDS